MRAAAIIYIYVLLGIVDRLTIWIALESGTGTGTNPHFNTDSLWSIFFSPVPLFYSALFLVCVLFSEFYSDKIHASLVRGHPLAPFWLLPLFLIWMLSFMSMSNVFNVLELGTPLAWFASLFDFMTEDRNELVAIALVILNIAGLPLLSRMGILIYAPKGSMEPVNIPPVTESVPN